MDTGKKRKIFVVLGLVLLGVFYRFLDHPFNFTPLAAIALFSGYYLKNRWSFLLPLAVLFVSDLFLGFYGWPIMLSVYLCFGVNSLLGEWLSKNSRFSRIAGASVLGSVLFFAVTNFSVWFFGGWYPKNFEGFISCYYMALPFFRNTFFGDLFFTGMIFGIYEMAMANRKLFERVSFFGYKKDIY
jgi:hypothetical protein